MAAYWKKFAEGHKTHSEREDQKLFMFASPPYSRISVG